MFRFHRDTVIGRNLEMLIPERFRKQHPDHVKRFSQTQSTSRKMGELGKNYGLASDGREFPLEASISQTETDSGRIFTVILRDITERIRSEQIIAERLELEVTLSRMAASTPGVFIVYRVVSGGAAA